MSPSLRRDPWLSAALAAYAVYGVAFLWQGSFVIDGQRWFTLFDDAMISMRFARHLAEGYGLVYNIGQARVEGFTNPLWTIYMALWHLSPLPLRLQSLAIQGTGLVLLAATATAAWRLTLRLSEGSRLAAGLAFILCAAYLPLNFFGLYGMEVSALAFIVLWSVDRALSRQGQLAFDPWLWSALAFGTAVRLDGVVPFLAILLWRLAVLRRGRGREAAQALGLLLLTLGAQTLWRYRYYGAWLPNTYALKMTGYPWAWRISRGAFVLKAMLWNAGWYLFAGALAAAYGLRHRGALLLAVVFGAQCAYSVYVGGDAWEWWGGANRYLSVGIPAAFVLMAMAAAWAWQRLPQRAQPWAALALGVLMVARLNMIDGTRRPWQEALLQRPPLNVAANGKFVVQGRALLTLLKPGGTATVTWAGTVPYFIEGQYLDLLGKNDAHIAQMPARANSGLPGDDLLPPWRAFYPGHLKWDYSWTLGQLHPDMVFDLWTHPEEAQPYLDKDYVPVQFGERRAYLRRGSPRIDWEKAKAFALPAGRA